MTLQPVAIDFIFICSLNNLKGSDKWLAGKGNLKTHRTNFKWENNPKKKLNNNTFFWLMFRNTDMCVFSP